jgi:hypothetical protein
MPAAEHALLQPLSTAHRVTQEQNAMLLLCVCCPCSKPATPARHTHY